MNTFRVLEGYRAYTGHVFTEKQARLYIRALESQAITFRVLAGEL